MTDLALETRAIRMLHAGDAPKEVAQTTGLTVDQVRQLQRDFPGPRRRTTPTTAAPTPAPTDDSSSCRHITDLPVALLHAHPGNIRATLGDPVELEQLTQSIREQGVLQPLVVMRLDRRYVLLAGHRRLAAAAKADLTRVPVVFHDTVPDANAVEAMLVENLQRAALDPLDEAEAYRSLMNQGRSMAQIARAVGKHQGHISARVALLNLTSDEQAALRRKEITIRSGYLTGRDRSSKRRPHDTKRPKPKVVPHFTKAHPLASAAAAACDHDTLLKLGVACGPCWEATIRADEQRRADTWSGGDA